MFRLSDEQWSAISKELSALGRFDCAGDRFTFELVCWGFVALRPKLGKNQAVPSRAHDAWLDVAKAARELDRAIEALRPAGAADFTMLDNHQGGLAEWRTALDPIAAGAEWAAELEMYARADGGKTDPMRDGFVLQLLRLWQSYGGRPEIAYDAAKDEVVGPLRRFLTAATTPALAAVGEAPLTGHAIRGMVRKLGPRLAPQIMAS